MSAKRKRKSTSTAAANAPKATEKVEKSEARQERPRSRNAPRGRLTPGGLAPSPFPTLGVSVARGLRAVGSSPVILTVSFLSLLLTWGAVAGLGVETSPRFLAALMSISPAHVFSDFPAAFSAAGGSLAMALLASAGMGLLRALTFGLLMLLLLGAMEDGTPDLPASVRRLPRVAVTLLSIYVVEVVLAFTLLQVVAGFLGQLSILVVVAGIYFLAFVPVVATGENASLQESFRRGVRAARLPGTRHLTLVMVYFLFLFYLAAVSPFGLLAPATPGVLTWAFALMATFLHTSVLGALIHRWLVVRDQISGGASGSRTRSPSR